MRHKGLADCTVLFLVSEDWYFWSHRLPIARAARDAGARVVVAARMAKHRSLIEQEGFEAEHIPFDRSGLNPFYDIRTFAAIFACYRRIRPDLVHHVAAKPVLLGQIAAFANRIPSVVNAMAGMGFLYIAEERKARILRSIFEFVIRLGIRHGANLIVQNEDDLDLFCSIGIPRDTVTIIPGSGVDTKLFKPQLAPKGEPIAVCVARMLRHKGIAELVEAARILKQRRVPLRIRLVGDTDPNPAGIPRQQLAEWREEGAVEIVGPSCDVVGEYARAHLAVLPSYREGLPKSLLEAAAAGLPLVATDVPGCREICRDGETGILVPPKDPAALADALAYLANDIDTRERLGATARRLVEARFAQEHIVRETLEIYAKLVSGQNGR